MRARTVALKDCVIQLAIAGTVLSAAFALCLWMLGSAFSSLQPQTLARRTEEVAGRAYQPYVVGSGQTSLLDLFLNPLLCVAFVLAAIWCLYRLFMHFCEDLDGVGHWGSAISRRSRRHHR